VADQTELRWVVLNEINNCSERFDQRSDADANTDSDADTDLEPLALRYAGVEPSVPLQLTATAVVPDMPIEVYLLGDSRAIPKNYLHVQLNPLQFDWRRGGEQRDVLTRAVDEAGGKAFETVSAVQLGEPYHLASWYDLGGLKGMPDLPSWLAALQGAGFRDVTIADLAAVVPVDPEVDPAGFFACPTCFPDALQAIDFDAVAFTDALEAQYLDPIRAAATMVEASDHLTRLRTTMSASEMTVDPIFRFDEDLPLVSAVHYLELSRTCDDPSDDAELVPFQVEISLTGDDLVFMGPSPRDLRADGSVVDGGAQHQ